MYNTAKDIDSRIDQWIATKTVKSDDCFLWHGTWDDRNETPLARFDGSYVDVHRAIFNERVSLLGDHEVVYATCGDERCVNPDHLDVREMQVKMRRALDARARAYRNAGSAS